MGFKKSFKKFGRFVDPTNTSNNDGLGNVVQNFDPFESDSNLNNIIGDDFGMDYLGANVSKLGRFVDPFNTSNNDGLGNVVQNFDVTDSGTVAGGAVDDISSAASDALASMGMTDGDASSEQFGKIWPYKKSQLDAAQDLFNSDGTLNPDFSDDTQSYIDQTRSRATDGNQTLNNAENSLNSLFGSTDPTAGFYGDMASGATGQNNPAAKGYADFASGAIGSNNPSNPLYQSMQSGAYNDPAMQGYQNLSGSRNPTDYSNISNRSGVNPVTGMVQGALGAQNPTEQFGLNLMGSNTNANNPSTQFYQNNMGALGNNAAFNQLGKTSSGDYLNNNPYLDQIFNSGSKKLTDTFKDSMNNINSSFNLSGGFGSSARKDSLVKEAGTLNDSLGGLYNNIYGGNYQAERDRQQNATNALGQFSDAATGRVMQGADRLGANYNQGLDRNVQGAGIAGNNYLSGINNTFQGAGMIGDQFNQDTSNLFNVNNANSSMYNQDFSNRMGALSGMSGANQNNINNMFQGAQGQSNNYNQNMSNQLTGLGGASNIYNQGINNQFQGAAGQSGVYNQGFNNQLNAINPAFQFANQDYTDLGQLGNVGNIQDTQNRNIAMEPWNKVDMFGNAIGGIPQSQPQQQKGNPLFALGGAALGAYLAPVGGGVAGAQLGAGLGGLLG